MKHLNLIIASLIILSACNSKPKQTSEAHEAPVVKSQQLKAEKPQASGALTREDYDAFLFASLENKIDIVKAEMAKGIDVNWANEEGRTALMLASFNGHTGIVKMLLDAGADCRMVDATNRSALMFACTGPFLETVKVLMQAGSEINGTDSHENWTPVMFAAGEGQLEVVKFLMESGADVTMVDVDGESAYDFAVSRGHATTADYLKEVAQKH